MKKKFTNFRPVIKSRHPSHDILRNGTLPLKPYRAVVRLGSTTDMQDTVSNGGKRLEFNTIQSIRNSANKKLMKDCFVKDGVKTPIWLYGQDVLEKQLLENLGFPIVAKHIFGSRGTSNTLIKDQQELDNFLVGKQLNRYIFEKFYSYNREYRLHVTEEGCFYTCRKVLKEDTPENKRWFRNDSNCNWIKEDNDMFDKPVNWQQIEEECVKALKSVGLDAGACDVKVQSRTNKKGKVRENPEFIVIEINSAPSFGEITSKKYIEVIPKILDKKWQKLK